jgi:hypothetical protein
LIRNRIKNTKENNILYTDFAYRITCAGTIIVLFKDYKIHKSIDEIDEMNDTNLIAIHVTDSNFVKVWPQIKEFIDLDIHL